MRNSHLGPLRVQKSLYPEGDATCHAIVLHPPAGIVGGDDLEIAVALDSGAHALLTTPGAGKWYRSGGRRARMIQRLSVAAGATCEWLPQESIVFDGAEGQLTTEVALAAGATFIGAEMICLGRTGSGERFDSGYMNMSTRVIQAGTPIWLERAHLEGGSDLLQALPGLAGAPVSATLLIVGAGVDEALRDACRAVVPTVGRGAVSLLPGVLVARWLGPASEPGRDWLARLWATVRPPVVGREAQRPRIWAT